ncbi:MAG: M6 family metalloprotease domain-containing protein [Bacteroidales bacterium]|nr:M6 family metalloprotease domain-containing protein [Bacteroidales bacterium]
MKKLNKTIALLSLALGLSVPTYGIIANPEPVTVVQPDGSKVTLVLHGDEFYNYTTTTGGYTVAFNHASKAWEYAQLAPDGTLVPAGETASDLVVPRSGIKGLKPQLTESRTSEIKKARKHLKTGQYDYTKFRGLVILVEYEDAPFIRSDAREIFNDMINKPDYEGYMSDNLLPSLVPCTGSVRDYYYENSSGLFDPKFDVVGPVKIPYSQFYARKSTGAQALVTAALNAADELIDYKDYDTDKNNRVDMVYFIFSGAGSNFSGNDERLIWPHASTVMGLSLDGVSFERYACSTELYGQPAARQLDGIGTVCHEFSHVLGLPDLYDVDYETGGQAFHPQRWSVMASGSYLNMSKTPCGYSLFERMALGFANPKLIESPGEYTIKPLNEGGTPDGARINSAVPNEFFLLEARTKTRWDAYLPGEGLLVHRVDSTDASVWENNKVNAKPNHTYLELLRAQPVMSTATTIKDSDSDPFPGSAGITSLTNATSPSIRSWTMSATPLILEDITQNENGSISFSVKADNVPTLVEDFQTMAPTGADTTNVDGRFTKWDFTSKARIVSRPDSTGVDLQTVKGSEIFIAPIDGKIIESAAITITNPTSSATIFRFYYSTDHRKTWKTVASIEGSTNATVAKGSTATLRYNLGSIEGADFRIAQYTGSTSAPCTINDVTFTIKGDVENAVESITADDLTDKGEVRWFTVTGQPVGTTPTVPGLYIRVQGQTASKVIVR